MAPASAPSFPLLMVACLVVLLASTACADSSSSSSSPSSSSEEHLADVLEAGVQECVRKHTPPMIGGGDYAELAKLTSCVSDGMEALEAATAPALVDKQIADCVNAKPFPDSLKPVVASFLSCVAGILT